MTAYHGCKQRIGKKIYEESEYIEEDEDFIIKGSQYPFLWYARSI